MTKMIFVNLPVEDVGRATAFYAALGFKQDPMFSGEHASSMAWSDAIVVMLLAKPFFQTFTKKQVADPRTHVGSLISISLDSRDEVDRIAEAAVANGGRELHGAEDHGFMYSRAFEDPDGHGWGPLYMDMAAFAEAKAAGHAG
ncbi:hypothetical protein GGQ80_003397 [Sphingomonas jinjuensis]|uniref:VOC domain-containing protein n=2 Tax=Sphingomonas jinjuensis TaxID=535907 RepID=A0A840FIE9_9SPHN|nr:hypothetical protein [Sphingomonas jinjuensis]